MGNPVKLLIPTRRVTVRKLRSGMLRRSRKTASLRKNTATEGLTKDS
jgi:hypothetical protein